MKYPEFSDVQGWNKQLRDKYRPYPFLVKIVLLLFCVPFTIVKWVGEHGEALMDVLSESRDRP